MFNERERHAFLDTRGHLVERYTSDLLSRSFGARFIRESLLQECAPKAKVCDGIIVYPDALILVEYKTASPLLATRHAENYNSYRAQWRRAVTDAADQFESTVSLVRTGAFAKLGVDATIRHIYPVMGVFEQIITQLTYRAIRQDDLSGHPLSARMVARSLAPIQFLSIRDFELWEIAVENGHSILELMRAKTSDPEYVELPLQNFVDSCWQPLTRSHSRWHEERFRELADRAMAFFKDLGMPHRGPAPSDQ